MIFKKGIATISVEKEGNFVKKYSKLGISTKKKEIFIFTGCLLDFVPKLHKFDDDSKTIWTEYCGQSLNLKYIPKDRYKFKPQIKQMVEFLARLNLYHNDIRWKNVVESDSGQLF